MTADPVMVLHTTEGHSIESAIQTMKVNRSQCHEVIDPRWPDLRDSGMPLGAMVTPWAISARSLKHPISTPETNNRGYTTGTAHLGKVYQVEIVGFARDIQAPEEEWRLRLATYLVRRCEQLGVPKQFPYAFHGETAYGVYGSARLGWDQWQEVSGIVGHQHVPGNLHWDPGKIDRVISPLVIGSSDEPEPLPAIEQWQRILVDTGHDLGASGPQGDGVDGDFGPKTLAASKEVFSSAVLVSKIRGLLGLV